MPAPELLHTLRHDPRSWLEANLAGISQVVARTAHRHRLPEQDREDLLSILWTHLTRDDYRVLRRYRGSSGIMTYLTTVTERLVLDGRTAAWGKWRPSARARRYGDRAILFERLVHRDGLPSEQAHRAVQHATGDSIAPHVARELMQRSPYRRRRFVELDQALTCCTSADPLSTLVGRHLARRGAEIGRQLEQALRSLPAADQLLLRMRHEQGLKISEIAVMLQLEPKKLYRRLATIQARVRAVLTRVGVSSHEARELTGDRVSHLPSILCHLDRAC